MGEIDGVNGFPLSYSDGTIVLGQCLSGPQCVGDIERADPSSPVSYPNNFPLEHFYFAAFAGTPEQPDLYEAALEAAYANDVVVSGDEVAFGRIRVQLTGMETGATYTIAHPYGQFTVQDNGPLDERPADGVIRVTSDTGCLAPCTDFALAGAGFLGNSASATDGFLTQENTAGAGFIGDLLNPGPVGGAPSGLNAVVVTGPNAGGSGVNTLTVTDFGVSGMLASDPVVPTAPSTPTATAGLGSARVNWTAPGNGGSTITQYTVQSFTATGVLLSTTVVPAARGTSANSTTITGLPNGTAVSFQVQARNTVGTGPFSARSRAVTPTLSRLSDFNSDGIADVVSRDAAGRLWLYGGNATGLLARRQMGTGWNGFTAIITPGDVTGDGKSDILARTAAGALRVYPGNGAGRLGASRHLGTGWGSFTALTNAGDMTGDGRTDVLARDSAGRLWIYPMVGNAGFQARRLIGTGWNGMTSILGAGDVSGDGRADIVARDRAGLLWVYRGNGAGRVSGPTAAGTGWQRMTALLTPGNLDRVAGSDLLAMDAAGKLWLYPGNNAGRFGTRRLVGNGGWQAMSSIS